MENVDCQGQNAKRFMTFEQDQDKDPAIVTYTRELFARYVGTDADKCLVQHMRTQARRYLHQINDGGLTYSQLQQARSRRQWLLHLLSVAEYSLQLLRPFMARVIVESRSTATA